MNNDNILLMDTYKMNMDKVIEQLVVVFNDSYEVDYHSGEQFRIYEFSFFEMMNIWRLYGVLANRKIKNTIMDCKPERCDCCMRVRRDFYWAYKNYVIEHKWRRQWFKPELNDRHIHTMYLEDQEEKRQKRRRVFLIGIKSNISPLSKITEVTQLKYIWQMANL